MKIFNIRRFQHIPIRNERGELKIEIKSDPSKTNVCDYLKFFVITVTSVQNFLPGAEGFCRSFHRSLVTPKSRYLLKINGMKIKQRYSLSPSPSLPYPYPVPRSLSKKQSENSGKQRCLGHRNMTP